MNNKPSRVCVDFSCLISVAHKISHILSLVVLTTLLASTAHAAVTVGEYRFDDCGGGEWLNDYSVHGNTATGTKKEIHNDGKSYACTSLSAYKSYVEVPHIPEHAMAEGAVSMLVYDHHSVWGSARLLEKTQASGSDQFNLTMKSTTDSLHGTFSVDLNGNSIDTGETFFSVTGAGGDLDTDWVHVMFTFGSQGMRLYIDGQLKGTNAYTGGFSNLDGVFELPYFSGYYDEFYILDGQPSDAEVQGLYSNLIANKNIDGSDRTCDCSSSLAAISGRVYLDENGNNLRDVTALSDAGSLQNDLLLLYNFGTGSGNTVYDISGVGSPMNLSIADPSKVTWLPEGGLSIDSATLLQSPADTKLITALQASNEMTLETWIKPENLSQTGPARIATFSENTALRNMTLGQQNDDYEVRLRTSTNSNNGNSPKTTATNDVATTLQHVVYTRTAAGSARIYVDGSLVASTTVDGDFSNLDSSHLFGLANELTANRPWLGEFYKVALYQRALDASEVSGLFSEGYLDSEPLLTDISVSLYNDNGTSSTTADDIFLGSANSAADGSYVFSVGASGLTYRIEVDATDADLPADVSIGTANPLTSVTVTAGNTTVDQDFGFDPTPTQPVFTCDANIYIGSSTAQNVPSQFYSVDTAASPFGLNAIGDTAHGHSYNAMGYREQDNYLYAIKQASSNLLRIGADGSIVDLGAISGLPVPSNIWQTYDSGDVFPDGYLYIHEVTSHPELYKIDVTTTPPSLVQTITLNQSIWLSDFAYNKIDNKVYGIGDQGEKFMIDPATWAVSTVGNNAPAASYGAAYTDNAGNVYIYKNNPGTFYQVDFGLNGTGTGDMTELSTAPNVSFNDGASCRGEPLGAVGAISGMVYTDNNSNDSYDSGPESGIDAITVTLLNDANGVVIASTSSAANGSYSFSGLDTSLTYLLAVDATDPDLSGKPLGTTNPLSGVVVTANNTTADQNFGFDLTSEPELTTVGEYRFDDCGGAEWLNDYSIHANTATGTKKEIHNDGKNYACTSLSAYQSNVEVPHIPEHAMTEGAVSILVYDHHNVWATAQLLEKNQTSGSDQFELTMKRSTDSLHGTFSVDLNGNSIDTGETFFSVTGAGGDLDTDWVHVMFTFGPQGMRLYVDGQLKGTNAYTGGFSNLDSVFQLPYFSGYYDEFYILDGQPSDAQVQGLYSNLVTNKNMDGSDRTCGCSSPFTAISGKVYLDENGNNQHDVFTSGGAGSLQDDLLLLYRFGAGSGDTVYDISGVGSPMNLSIADSSKVTWMGDGGLSVDDSTLLQAATDTKLITALQASNEITVEAWVKPDNLSQSGPARIVTFSSSTSSRNMTLGQQSDGYQARLRTSTNSNNGNSPVTDATNSADTALQHVVYTRTAAGAAQIYVDGALAGSETIDGDFSNFDSSHLFALANELTGDRPWLGEYYKVAVYQRALDAAEVSGLYAAGATDGEPLLADITLSLYNANGTSNTTIDDIFLESVSTTAGGTYQFGGVLTGLTYRVEVDAADTDLPAGVVIGTTNPLTGVADEGWDFGFDPPPTDTWTPPVYEVCKTTSVEQLDAFQYATATGAGSTGTPGLNYTAPTGSNRMMVAILSVERDHTPALLRGDNFETNNPGVTTPIVTFGGVPMQSTDFNVESFGSSTDFADAEISRSYYFYTLFDLGIPAGEQALEVSGINQPNNIAQGDDAILTVATFANVADINPIETPYSAVDRAAPFSIELSASPVLSTAADQPPGTSSSDNMLLAFGSSSRSETLNIGSGWSKLAEIHVLNGSGSYATPVSGRVSGPFTENDGHTLLVQGIKGVSTPQTARMSSSAANIAGLGMHVFRMTAQGCDYGDAPTSYGDAYHSQSASRRIGAQRGDAETATSTGVNASGDDSGNLDDEDGVTIPLLDVGGSGTINVEVAGSAYLAAWIDWNSDGDFSDMGEQVATDLQDADADGNIQIAVNVPATATAGQTYARFRWSIDTGTAASGWASYGEVEDYTVTIQNAASCSLVVTTTADSDSAGNNSGSLRDAIECANATSGADIISFNMPTTEAGFTNPAGADNDYWSILLSSPLPGITDAVTIDGRTQTSNRGNTNSGDIATATTVGVDNVPLPAVAAPEVEVVGQTSFAAGFDFKDSNISIYGLGLRRFDTAIRMDRVNVSDVVLSGIAFGVNPVTGADPGAGQRSNQHIAIDSNANNVSFTLDNSVLGYTDTKRGIFTDGIANLDATIHNNHFVGIGQAGNATNAAIQFLHTQSPVLVISENRFTGRGLGVASDAAVDFDDVGGGNTTLTIENNTISGFDVGISYHIQAVTHDLFVTKNRIFDNTDSALSLDRIKDATVSQNHLYGNGKHGVSISSNTSKGNLISKNSIYNNGEAGINLVGGNQVDPGGITLNDAGDGDNGPNALLNFPMVLQAVLTTTNEIIIQGCAPADSVVEFFEADVSPGGAATPGDNSFSLSDDYGEGQTYLFRLVEGSVADSESGSCTIPGVDGNDHSGMNAFRFSVPVPASIAANDALTATATLTQSGTSEFSPITIVSDTPPPVGGGSCSVDGGTDILFVVDNSGSISAAEYTDFSQTIQTAGAQFLSDNANNRLAIAHFGGPTSSLASGGQYVYIERDFSTDAMLAPVRQFGHGGAYNTTWTADHLAGAIEQMRYSLDNDAATSSSLIISPLKEMTRDASIPLQIVLMTDASRYLDDTPSDISMLIDPAGSGAEPNDASDYTVYNQLKADEVSFSVVSFNNDPVSIASSAAIASFGGTYTGTVDANTADPEGSQVTPRRYIPVTSGFQLTTAQVKDLAETVAICGSSISGTVFEDLSYGGGDGRPFGTAGTVGLAGANIEVYDSDGAYAAAVTSDANGSYRLPNLPGGDYYVRVVNSSAHSSRTGSDGREMAVMTYRSNGTTAVINEVGGRHPTGVDAVANIDASTLNPLSFVFSGGSLDTQVAQSVQPITLVGVDVDNADFGFNFNTIVNTNSSGQGSLQQFVFNNNLLDSTGIAQQLPTGIATDYSASDAVAVFMIPGNQLNSDDEAVILNSDALSIESARTVIDGRVQSANIGSGTISIQGDGSSLVTGVYFNEQANGSVLRSIAISEFGGSGVDIYGTGSSASVGVMLEDVSIYSNGQYGVLLQNGAEHNQVINSIISVNGWAGIASDAASLNTFSQNSLYDNGALGIDLGLDGVTANSNDDIWLNYPEVVAGSSISSNGSMIVSYDFDLEVPANTHGYRVEFFSNAVIDPSGHGEGLTYLGYEDIMPSGTGPENFKGSINTNQLVPENANIAVTLTEKLGAATLGATSEFSGVQNGNLSVCTDLLVDPDAPLPTITLDENSTDVTYLEALDEDGNPVTYAISGGADANKFVINPVPPGALFDCLTIEFVKDDGIIGTRTLPVSSTRAGPPAPQPGNYEVPVDSGRDNTYDLIITATDVNGNQVTKPVSVIVQNVNENPRITNSADVDFVERQGGVVIDLEAYDPDADDAEGSGLSYSISGGVDARQFAVDPYTGKLRFTIAPDFDSPTDKDADNVYELTVRVTDDQGLASSKNLSVSVVDDPDLNGVSLRARALLQGAYEVEAGLMHDMLRSTGVLPVPQPYSGQPFNHSGVEQINLDLALVEGDDAIVDWVLLELRAANDSTLVLASKAGLIQRDGDIVDAGTGLVDLNFPAVVGGQYYISLRHRNHLGVITAAPVTVSVDAAATMVDFSQPETAILGEYARLQMAANDGGGEIAVLWSGDVNQDQRLIVNGQGSDLNPILSDVLTAPENTTYNTSYQLAGYHVSDLNMDGVTLFIGPGNDANILLGNILLHPSNDGFQSNFVGNGGLQ